MKSIKTILFTCIILLLSCYVPTEKPEDFDAFWQESLDELGSDFKSEIIKDSVSDTKRWTLNKIESFQGIHFYAWITEPLDDQKHPVKIKFSGFGRGNTDPNAIPHKWFLSEKKSINMVVDIRGQGRSVDQIQFKGYLSKGLENKDDYIYRGAFMDAVRSIDFIADHSKSDGNIIVYGGSQGGALSIVATALNEKVTMSVIGFPFLTDMYNYDKKKWPMKIFIHEAQRKEIDYDELHETLSYFDMINFAEKINTPMFLRTQQTDTITPKEGAIKFFKKVKSKTKKIHIENCEGHGCSSKSKEANAMEKAFIKANLLNQ